MLIRTEKPGKDFTYPCSKSDTKQVFGKDLLDSVYFGHEYHIDRRCSYPTISGHVIASAQAHKDFQLGVSLYRTAKGFYCVGQREQFVRLLKSQVRPWIEAKRARSETEAIRYEELLVEFVGGGFKLHQVSYIKEWN